jgi:acetyltransferase-like isoleucine patch superfamily enzyme
MMNQTISPPATTMTRLATSQDDGLRRSRFAPCVRFLYRLLNCRRRWKIARLLIGLILRLEGGPMRSRTARELMSRYHGVEVGAYSYGDCFDPKIIPYGVTIGRYVSIASGVRMFVRNHPIDRLSTHPFFYERCPGVSDETDFTDDRLEIGHDVWIGCNVLITPGCRRVGHGAIIGAGAVVTRDVPDFAIVAGTPARHLRDRFPPEVAARLVDSQWWLLPAHEVQSRLSEFTSLLKERE